MKQLPAPTASNINEAHRLARSTAESAVQYAIQCGQLLAAKKQALKHGEFQQWVEQNCEFSYSTCNRYMKAGQNSHAVEISALRHLFPSGQPGAKPKANTSGGAVSVVNPEGGRTTGAKEGTEETGDDRPAALVSEPFAEGRPPAPKPAQSVEAPADPDEPDRPDIDEDEEDAALARAEARARDDRDRRVDKILESDDQLAEALAQLKQQAALIATLETTRDSYMRGKDAVTQLLKAEQAKSARLEKKFKAAEAEIEKLRERIAIMEAA